MKKVILGSVMAAAAVVSLDASAGTTTAYCTGGNAGAGAAVPATAASTFHKTDFKVKCSANVHLVGDDNTTYYRVGAASTKGKSAFGGSTMGGAVSNAGSCAVTGCVATDASNAATSATSS